MMSDREFALSEALKATAYDLQRLADKHVEPLRQEGIDDVADAIEQQARDAKSLAEEFDDD